VLCCVSTQFIMMLNAQEKRKRDLSSLRCMFTGGEAVPYHRAAEFEDVTGAAVLQFYGSNETGALSRTTAADTRERRLTSAGALIPRWKRACSIRRRKQKCRDAVNQMPRTRDVPWLLG